MIHMNANPFLGCLYFTGLVVSSPLWFLTKLHCSQQDISCSSQIVNCSDGGEVVPRRRAPAGPEWGSGDVGAGAAEDGLHPVLNITWRIPSNAGIFKLYGTKISILDESTNDSTCVEYAFRMNEQLKPDHTMWTFSLDGLVVEPGHTYSVSVFNLPEPDDGHYRVGRRIPVPRCDDWRIRETRVCLENGSLWDPRVSGAARVDWRHRAAALTVRFATSEFSERYRVSVRSPGAGFCRWKDVSKENRSLLDVTFDLEIKQLSKCEIFFEVQPFFIGCRNNCLHHKKKMEDCPYHHKPLPLAFIIEATLGLAIIGGYLVYSRCRTPPQDPANLPSADGRAKPEGAQVPARNRVFILHSLDHPLYTEVVLKLCAFLRAKCGTDVVLDLLDSARLAVLGAVQWLDWHQEQVERSSDKILILCSPGVQAKWRAMCGSGRVLLRGDRAAPLGDMLTAALGLVIPRFVRSASYRRYLVAYFEDICSEEDVPSPFNVTVRYRLMAQFEEVFFRILEIEKHTPGRVSRIEGLAEDEYHLCPTGGALRDAIHAFSSYQREHPRWFEDELVGDSVTDVGPDTCRCLTSPPGS